MKRMFMIVLLMFVFVLSACGDNNTENTVEENDAQANEVQESEEQSNDIEEKLDKADENQASEKEETFSEVGILKEQIASDRIEIETDDGVTEFKLTKEAQEDVDYVDVGDEVQFTYYEEDGEPTIGFIEKVSTMINHVVIMNIISMKGIIDIKTTIKIVDTIKIEAITMDQEPMIK